MNEAVMKIEQEVLTTWPADAIARAEDVVLCLSGMIEAVRPDTDITEVAKNNTLMPLTRQRTPGLQSLFLRESVRR